METKKIWVYQALHNQYCSFEDEIIVSYVLIAFYGSALSIALILIW